MDFEGSDEELRTDLGKTQQVDVGVQHEEFGGGRDLLVTQDAFTDHSNDNMTSTAPRSPAIHSRDGDVIVGRAGLSQALSPHRWTVPPTSFLSTADLPFRYDPTSLESKPSPSENNISTFFSSSPKHEKDSAVPSSVEGPSS